MREPAKAIICGSCKVPIISPVDPEPDDQIVCPRCGVRDRYEDAMKIAFDEVTDRLKRARLEGIAKVRGQLGGSALDAANGDPKKPFFKWRIRDRPFSDV